MVRPTGLSTESQCEMKMEESYNFVNEGLPEYVGEDPMRWILTAEIFFVGQKIYPSDKMQWTFMRMEGATMLWFQSWCLENLDADWKHLP